MIITLISVLTLSFISSSISSIQSKYKRIEFDLASDLFKCTPEFASFLALYDLLPKSPYKGDTRSPSFISPFPPANHCGCLSKMHILDRNILAQDILDQFDSRMMIVFTIQTLSQRRLQLASLLNIQVAPQFLFRMSIEDVAAILEKWQSYEESDDHNRLKEQVRLCLLALHDKLCMEIGSKTIAIRQVCLGTMRDFLGAAEVNRISIRSNDLVKFRASITIELPQITKTLTLSRYYNHLVITDNHRGQEIRIAIRKILTHPQNPKAIIIRLKGSFDVVASSLEFTRSFFTQDNGSVHLVQGDLINIGDDAKSKKRGMHTVKGIEATLPELLQNSLISDEVSNAKSCKQIATRLVRYLSFKGLQCALNRVQKYHPILRNDGPLSRIISSYIQPIPTETSNRYCMSSIAPCEFVFSNMNQDQLRYFTKSKMYEFLVVCGNRSLCSVSILPVSRFVSSDSHIELHPKTGQQSDRRSVLLIRPALYPEGIGKTARIPRSILSQLKIPLTEHGNVVSGGSKFKGLMCILPIVKEISEDKEMLITEMSKDCPCNPWVKCCRRRQRLIEQV